MITTEPNISGKFLIKGIWIEAQQTANVINPANINEVVGRVALCTEQEVKDSIESAENAYQTWKLTSLEDRANRMIAAAEELQKIVEENVSLYVRENGKPLVEAKKDLLRCVDIMKQGAEELFIWSASESLPGAQKVMVRKRPRGVAAIIMPWNSPLILTFKRVVPAILTGNTVVVKPATNCPLALMTFLQVVSSYFPAGVINVVTGSGALIGDILCTDPRIRTVAFVGSTETGKDIIRKSASTVKKMYMELGGNDPAIILEDAVMDEQAITKLRMGILKAAGQVCSAIKRVYVHESRYDEVVSKLTKEFQHIYVGNGIQPDAMMGPLNNKKQFEYVSGLIERAKASGAQVNTVGIKLDPETWDQGYFMLPSIVTGVNQQSEIVREEQFGPVIPILPFKTVEEVIEMANDTEYGLRASVWTENEELAVSLADRLEAGAVFHNNHTIFQDLHLDFPGAKESGLSRETRHCGMEYFSDSYGFAN
ncbi:aldehyde dehydrogenase family protein [Niallia endozanthoxylica]|uniref:Aldehyde dehydrogenase family protein n=1 Tax=Niallia endozanthoxylica TaxID=2036016 RepID=A0A5J5H5S1_9BACI|nr:aldehyde dehydrogenase family protein [Niallia endozanthoxylica]KAA9015966.1 aldehyde dehydrogenase family protein [Niallia endozanthoxylica]